MKTYQPLTKDKVNSIFGAGYGKAMSNRDKDDRSIIEESDISKLIDKEDDIPRRNIKLALAKFFENRKLSKRSGGSHYELNLLVESIIKSFYSTPELPTRGQLIKPKDGGVGGLYGFGENVKYLDDFGKKYMSLIKIPSQIDIKVDSHTMVQYSFTVTGEFKEVVSVSALEKIKKEIIERLSSVEYGTICLRLDGNQSIVDILETHNWKCKQKNEGNGKV